LAIGALIAGCNRGGNRRDGADPQVATTHFKIGREKLAAMTDEEVFAVWNEHIGVRDQLMQDYEHVPVLSEKPSRNSCSVATVEIEDSAETRSTSDRAERRVVVAGRWRRPDDSAADPLVVALG